MKSKLWTENELNVLMSNYPVYGIQHCVDLIGRTPDSIKSKAYSLGLKTGNRSAGRPNLTAAEYEARLMEREINYFPVEPYVDNKTHILHECLEGHRWSVRPKDILDGKNCPTCSKSGFDCSKPGSVYYVLITKDSKSYYKIGITNSTVRQRFKTESDASIKEIKVWRFDAGQDAKDMDTALLASHPRITVDGFLKSGGNTELFEYDVLELDR